MNATDVLLLLWNLLMALAFAPSSIRSRSKLQKLWSPLPAKSSLFVNETISPKSYDGGRVVTSSLRWNQTLAVAETEALEAMMMDIATATEDLILEEKRNLLKKRLAQKAITNFIISEDEQPQRICEDTAESIMKQLEQIKPLPIPRPATHYSLNANWSFVFTGVPTIGMKLITLLSRISIHLPFEILDFRDVSLKVLDRQTKAMAIVSATVCGTFDWELRVCTSLRRPNEKDFEEVYKAFRGEDGTLLLEHFQGIWLNGHHIPTPKKWHTTRTLEITYMDKDIMVARTSGGEPHLLLRNSPMCYTSEEMERYDDNEIEDEVDECSIDDEGNHKFTPIFADATEIYGKRLTRCLVDREFGKEEFDAQRKTKNAQSIGDHQND